MFQQIANDRGVQNMDCEAVIEFNGKLSCKIPEIGEKSELVLNEHDHRFLHWDEKAPMLILYGEIGTKSLKLLHEQLVKLATNVVVSETGRKMDFVLIIS